MIPRAGMLLRICLGLLEIAVAAQEPPVLVSPDVRPDRATAGYLGLLVSQLETPMGRAG
jgi:hypothetical protein